MVFRIEVLNGHVVFPCRTEQSVLTAMNDAGVRALKIGCRSGGCGVCRVQVISGTYETGCMSMEHVGDNERRDGIVLACKLFPRSDLVVAPLAKRSWAQDLRLSERGPLEAVGGTK